MKYLAISFFTLCYTSISFAQLSTGFRYEITFLDVSTFKLKIPNDAFLLKINYDFYPTDSGTLLIGYQSTSGNPLFDQQDTTLAFFYKDSLVSLFDGSTTCQPYHIYQPKTPLASENKTVIVGDSEKTYKIVLNPNIPSRIIPFVDQNNITMGIEAIYANNYKCVYIGKTDQDQSPKINPEYLKCPPSEILQKEFRFFE